MMNTQGYVTDPGWQGVRIGRLPRSHSLAERPHDGDCMHDVGFEPAGSNVLTVLNNAEFNHQKDKSVESRAQIWKLDEEKLTAWHRCTAARGKPTRVASSSTPLSATGYLF